jgi:hypothetical protein
VHASPFHHHRQNVHARVTTTWHRRRRLIEPLLPLRTACASPSSPRAAPAHLASFSSPCSVVFFASSLSASALTALLCDFCNLNDQSKYLGFLSGPLSLCPSHPPPSVRQPLVCARVRASRQRAKGALVRILSLSQFALSVRHALAGLLGLARSGCLGFQLSVPRLGLGNLLLDLVLPSLPMQTKQGEDRVDKSRAERERESRERERERERDTDSERERERERESDLGDALVGSLVWVKKRLLVPARSFLWLGTQRQSAIVSHRRLPHRGLESTSRQTAGQHAGHEWVQSS